MPKLNPYLIKENHKKIEMIQELEKYEIKKSPLSVAARGKVINKSGSGYVSENKGEYGPGPVQSNLLDECVLIEDEIVRSVRDTVLEAARDAVLERERNERERGENSSEKWTDLRMICPVGYCSNNSSINWTHRQGCGGNLEVSNKGCVKCRSCGTTSDIENWPLSCSEHSGHYTKVDANSLIHSLSIALRNKTMDRDIIVELLRNLMRR